MDAERDWFRIALQHLKAKYDKTAEEIATASGRSIRHIQGVLSDKEQKGVSRAAGYRLANLFGLTYQEMLNVGKKIEMGESINTLSEPSNVSPAHDTKPSRLVPLISWVQAGDFTDSQSPNHTWLR